MFLRPSEIHILCGASGAGKTTLILQTLDAWKRNAAWPMHFSGTRIFFVSADRTSGTVRERLDKFNLLDVTEHYSLVDDPTLPVSSLSVGRTLLLEILSKATKPFDILVLDPIALFIDGDLNRYKEVAKSLVNIGRIIAPLNLTVLGAHHIGKVRSDFSFLRPQDKISGSAALQAYSSNQMVLSEPQERNAAHYKLHMLSHDGPQEEYSLEKDSDGWFHVITEQNLSTTLLELCPTRTAFTTEDALDFSKNLDLSKRTLFRVLETLINEGKLKRIQRGQYIRISPTIN